MLNKIKEVYSHFLKSIDSRGWHYEAKIDYQDFKKKTSKKVKLTKKEKQVIKNIISNLI